MNKNEIRTSMYKIMPSTTRLEIPVIVVFEIEMFMPSEAKLQIFQKYYLSSGGFRISRWGGGGAKTKEIDPVGGGAHAGSAPWIHQC